LKHNKRDGPFVLYILFAFIAEFITNSLNEGRLDCNRVAKRVKRMKSPGKTLRG